MRLLGRRVHIAGSASPSLDPTLIVHAHEVVRRLVRNVLGEGATLVVQAGGEPRTNGPDLASPPLLFDWTVMEEAYACLEGGMAQPSCNGELLLFAVSSEKAQSEMPTNRHPLWDSLLNSHAVQVRCIRPGSRSGAMMRELQAREGNVLVTLGGGAGVEHLADMYARRRRPVVPLDPRIGSSRDDGTVGGEGLARLARMDTTPFFRLLQPGTEEARLAAATTENGRAEPAVVADRVLALLMDLVPPTAFFVRLVNRDHPEFRSVESFFRDVIEPVAGEAGYQRHEVGTDETRDPFMNVEIFNELHHAPMIIADLTGERPNCYLELGYALRGEAKVLITAKQGTKLPFDTQALPCHFWRDDLDESSRRASFQDFWRRNINRPRLVQPDVPF